MLALLAQRLLFLFRARMIELQAPHWWQEVPVLTGHHLILREVDVTDVDSLLELLTDPQVRRYISSPPDSVEAFEGFIHWAKQQREQGKGVCFAVVPNGLTQPVGMFQVRALEPTFKIAEWGFALGAPFWSTGVFREAAVLVAEFAFRSIGVHRLEARAVEENGRGNRALEKLGARGEAVLRGAFHKDHQQFLWAIVAGEWNPAVPAERSTFDATRLRFTIAQTVLRQRQNTTRAGGARSPFPFPFFLTDNEPL